MTESRPGKSRRKKSPRRPEAAKDSVSPKSHPAASLPPAETHVSRPSLPALPELVPGNDLVITDEIAGNTVLAVLRAVRHGESWSKLKGQVHRAFVTLNGVVCVDEARRVAAGDVLTFNDKPRTLPPRPSDVTIQFVDAHLVIVEKPSGMMTHRRIEEKNWSDERKSRQPSLDESLNELLSRRAASSGRSRAHTGLVRCVHRLDRDTSGVLVFARNELAEENLISQFRRHVVHRVYWAIVHGRPADGTIVSNLVRDRGDGRRGSVLNPKVGQRAVTHVRWLEALGDYSLVECRLETGRTNQIRIHMAEAGHLVCGDPKYVQPYKSAPVKDTSQAPRLALHAAELGFVHPVSGEELFFQMPFPPDLAALADRLRGTKVGIKS